MTPIAQHHNISIDVGIKYNICQFTHPVPPSISSRVTRLAWPGKDSLRRPISLILTKWP